MPAHTGNWLGAQRLLHSAGLGGVQKTAAEELTTQEAWARCFKGNYIASFHLRCGAAGTAGVVGLPPIILIWLQSALVLPNRCCTKGYCKTCRCFKQAKRA